MGIVFGGSGYGGLEGDKELIHFSNTPCKGILFH